MKEKLSLKITTYIREAEGTYSISIIILPTNKEYTYLLSSQYKLDKLLWFIKKKFYGKALKLLKENNIMEKELI